ncbi:hypothetical protein BCR36DRAFT_583563, partial [Piromyces finnis]
MADQSELDKFFEESPLFEEDRKREQEELKLLEKMLHNDNILDKSLRCKRCLNNNIDMRRIQLRRTDEEATLVYY